MDQPLPWSVHDCHSSICGTAQQMDARGAIASHWEAEWADRPQWGAAADDRRENRGRKLVSQQWDSAHWVEIGHLPSMLMRWSKVASKTVAADEMMEPVYLNRTRKNLIMILKVKCGNNKTIFYQKGIAIIFRTNWLINHSKCIIKFI